MLVSLTCTPASALLSLTLFCLEPANSDVHTRVLLPACLIATGSPPPQAKSLPFSVSAFRYFHRWISCTTTAGLPFVHICGSVSRGTSLCCAERFRASTRVPYCSSSGTTLLPQCQALPFLLRNFFAGATVGPIMVIQAFAGAFAPAMPNVRVQSHRVGSPRRPSYRAQTARVVSSTLRPPSDVGSNGRSSSGDLSRRDALSILAATIASPICFPLFPSAAAADSSASTAPVPQLVLPPLPYAPNALEPAIDRETMILHHDKHFAKYTEGANAALSKIPGGAAMVNGEPAKLADMLGNLDSIKDESVRKALRNNGGGYVRSHPSAHLAALQCTSDILPLVCPLRRGSFIVRVCD